MDALMLVGVSLLVYSNIRMAMTISSVKVRIARLEVANEPAEDRINDLG